MTTETPDASRRMPRWLYWALIASLALNLLFIGRAGAAFWHHRHGGFGPGEFGLMGFVRELPPDRQTMIRDQLTAARQTLRSMRRDVRNAWFDANTALAAEPFDKAALIAAMARQSEAEAKFKAAMAAGLADTADKLTPAERLKLQAWREKRRPRMFGRHGKHDGDKGDPPGGSGDQD